MTENVSPEMVERALALVRRIAEATIPHRTFSLDQEEARAIAAELPAQVDPVLLEARRMESEQAEANGFIDYALSVRNGDQDNEGPVRCRFEGIKRGRALATQGDRK